MKKYLLLKTLFLLGSLSLQGQDLTQTENYVYSRTYLEPVVFSSSTAKQVQRVNYLDGLGRSKQNISIKATPSGKDIVVPVEYDAWGRQVKDMLPLPQQTTQNGGFFTSPDMTGAVSVYGAASNYYSEKELEKSPLQRLQEQAAPGDPWKIGSGKTIQYNYESNLSSEVRKFVVNTSWATVSGVAVGSPVLSLSAENTDYASGGFYKAGTLYKNTVSDEDGNKVTKFTNGKGQVILVRKNDGTQNVDTYYAYNEYGQQAFVIPPLAVKAIETAGGNTIPAEVLDNLCYQYRYDNQDRLVEKKFPGKGWEYMVYDQQDRLVLIQDANLRTTTNNFGGKGWMFTKYDLFNRVVYTGFFANTATRQVMQNALNSMTSQNIESRSDRSPIVQNGENIYYTKSAFPTGSMTILSVNYYDSYPPGINVPTRPDNILGQNTLVPSPTTMTVNGVTTSRSSNGLPTASYVRNIEDSGWTKDYFWYDTQGRPIGTHSINHLGGYTKTETELDFTGLAKQVKTYHKRIASDVEKIITETFDYDNQNRLLVHKHQVDANPIEILTQNKYNELSQLESKKVGGTSLGSSLQQIDYKYNIRGWMTMINDPSNLGNDLFGYKINYNKVEGQQVPNNDYSDQKVKPKYNGNIAEVSWKTLTESNEPLKTYGYVYDSLNRLSAGFYQKAGNEFSKEYFEKLEYDLNGNITRLKRSAGMLMGSNTALAIDDLKYDYIGNKLIRVTDQQMNYSGYPYTANPGNIVYDNGNISGNGNMTSHPDKGISSIQYNYLNLPKQIVQNAKVTDYTYRADGVKIKKLFGDLETDYLDGFQYKSTRPSEENLSGGGLVVEPDPSEVAVLKLRIIPTSEGYYDVLNKLYIYNYTDHLGNVRLSYTDTNKDGFIQPRQYFQRQCDDVSSDPWDIPNCIDIWKPGEIVEVNNYYPFGLLHDYTATSQNAYQYKFLGQELQETGFYDMNARFYMPDLGIFGQHDPLSGKTLDPYGYAYQNPIFFSDPTGLEGDPVPGSSGTGNPQAIGTAISPIDVGEIVLNPSIRAVSNNNLATCSYCMIGQGQNLRQQLNIPGPPNLEKACRECNDAAMAGIVLPIPSAGVSTGTGTAVRSILAELAGGLRAGLWSLPLILKGDTPKKEPTITLYRGVSSAAKGTMYFEAIQGIAIPNGFRQVATTWGPHRDMEAHAGGDNYSIWTSWSSSKEVARNFATGVAFGKAIPGIIMSKNFHLSEASPNPFTLGEAEWLVPGVTYGAKVEYVLPRAGQ
ncbi:cell well associated RhsD protein [Chryseobacterium sp. StRB126]|uniref:DUF6443 domain-containing protein n=1 Tax=Chryseobacterium sp. StRB126 TaxID=878220 RepID=UPI0004E99774|nr:DUF6443 domain-containing protein [Chryseobacterium sp. StRB126]BAP32525.1 cell well associated RhsD protein [Chryseobacterium sp. StRB126]